MARASLVSLLGVAHLVINSRLRLFPDHARLGPPARGLEIAHPSAGARVLQTRGVGGQD